MAPPESEESANSAVIVSVITAPGTDWTRYDVPLVATSFRVGNKAGAEVDEAQFAAILADVQALRINGEWGADVEETVGFDAVTLTAP